MENKGGLLASSCLNLRRPSAAVVGAGLSGLTAGHRLQAAGWDVRVFESRSGPGGRVHTDHRDGFVIDTGACAIADSYTAYLALLGELGLRDAVVQCSPCVGVWRESKIELLWMNRLLSSLLHTRLLSLGSKLKLTRLIWDVARAKARGQLDYSDMARAASLDTETARDYALRVLNAEIDDYLGSPIVRSMLIADTNKISRVELFSGVANIFGSRICALKGGQGRLPDVLAARLEPFYGCTVTSVEEHEGRIRLRYREGGVSATALQFDACVVSCPLGAATEICVSKRSLLEPLCAQLGYTTAITVAIALKRAPACPAFLIQMPGCEEPDIALVFLNHNMAPDRAPMGQGLLDCHWESGAAERYLEASDEDISARTLSVIYRLFPELAGQVLFTHVARWTAALPRTAVGAYRAIGEFNSRLDAGSLIQFAADYMSAAGQNTAVELGNRAAARLLASKRFQEAH